MREIFAEKRENLLRIAIKDNGELVECLLEEESIEPQIGEIYVGRIKNILPSINSIFIDIGLKKEAYMYYSEELKAGGIKKGDNLLLEVVKEPLGNKGAKVSNKVSVAGKFMVLIIGSEGISISKKISQIEDRQRLIGLIKPMKNIEIVLRTDAINATEEELESELKDLLDRRDVLERKLRYSATLGKVDRNSVSKRLFEELEDVKTKVLVDDLELLSNIQSIIKSKDEIVLEYYNEKSALFDTFGIDKELIKLRHKKVGLKCGGYIIIDKTEAMYVIDVNSGKNIKGRDFNRTIFQTNMEAAKEVARQIRLRNLSGIIVVDFIDMRDEKQKPLVLKELKNNLAIEKGNVKVFPFTELDLVQISRKRKGKSIYEYLEESCKRCKGNGFLLKLSYLEHLIKNEIIKCYKENSIKDFYLQLDYNYKEEVENDIFNFLKNIDGLDKEIYLDFKENIEGYSIEPLIFESQKENYKNYKIKTIEKI